MNQDELDLLHAWLSGTVAEAEMPRLQALLRESAEARQTLRTLATVEVKLQEMAGANRAAAKVLSFEEGRPDQARHARPWKTPLAWAAVLAVLGLTGALLFPHAGTRTPATAVAAEQTENGCAVVAQVHGAAALRAGTIVKPGPLHLPGGLVQLEFFSGASVLVEGEADLEIKSAWEAECRRGKARVSVPPPAEGFRLRVPGMNLVDIGTEFGVSVDAAGLAEVHVFDGKVQARPEGEPARMVSGGESLRRDGHGALLADLARPALFTSTQQLDALVSGQAEKRFAAWQEWSRQARTDPRLVAYYPFEQAEGVHRERLVHNVALSGEPRTGAAVGARPAHGRWPMKAALEFKGAGDRVRLHLGSETYSAITLACWACIEGLDRKYNALLLTDGYDPGEPHWQIYEDGRLMFSIAYADPAAAQTGKKQLNQIYFSPPVFNLANQGRWHHLAVTYDNQSGAAIQYVDGQEISREVSAYHQPGRPISFGPAEIGNWGLPTEGHKFPIRNLNGRVDEFAIYRSALSPGEIAQIYEAGKPE